jgi:hypothetical protein
MFKPSLNSKTTKCSVSLRANQTLLWLFDDDIEARVVGGTPVIFAVFKNLGRTILSMI